MMICKNLELSGVEFPELVWILRLSEHAGERLERLLQFVRNNFRPFTLRFRLFQSIDANIAPTEHLC